MHSQQTSLTHDVWVEVDLAALRHNLRQVRDLVGGHVKIMAVVKGNGFGHGYLEPSRAFVRAGADALAVTRIEEALPLREAGITAPILLFAPIQPDNAEAAVRADLQMTVADPCLLGAISSAATKLGTTAHVHLKVDTGMGRLGMLAEDAPGFVCQAKELPGVRIAGIYTHFASAAAHDLSTARDQLERFRAIPAQLKASGADYGLAHAANSAAILRMPQSHMDMVRPGTILYGQYPSQHLPHRLDLKPTWQLKARVCEVRHLPRGAKVGYGGEFTASRPTTTAVIPIGYAEGFTLAPEGPIYRQSILKFAARKMKRRLTVSIGGKRAPVIGRVAMQICVVDVTDLGPVQVGDEVVIPAMRIPTSALVPRVYVDSSG